MKRGFPSEGQSDRLNVIVVVPAHDAASEIADCLTGILAAGFDQEEIILVDDGSSDGTGDVARGYGVSVVRNETAAGPAEARNRGVRETQSEFIVFVDADVVIHEDARALIEQEFATPPDLVACFGSYDDEPRAPRLVSRYRNILHHYVHQVSAGDIQSFWTGFGVVRRDAFLSAGGFSRNWEMLEDVEFGLRLAKHGRIRIVPELLCTHLKDWTLPLMFRTDLFGRAVPWTRLIVLGRSDMSGLNLALSHRLSSVAVLLALVSTVLAPFNPALLLLTAVSLAGFVALNARFFMLLGRKGGIGLMLASIPFHALHHLAAILGFIKVFVFERLSGGVQRGGER